MAEIDALLAVLAGELARATSGRSVVCVGCPVRGWGDEPLPLALVPSPFDALPLASETLQLVVARAVPAGFDLAERCARAKVSELWLLRPAADVLERLSEPAAGRYRRRSLILPGDSLTIAASPAVRFTPLARTQRVR